MGQYSEVTAEFQGLVRSLVRQIDGIDSYLIESVRAVVRAE